MTAEPHHRGLTDPHSRNGVDRAETVELLSSPATTVAAARATTRDYDWPMVPDAYLGCYAAATTRRSA